MDFQIPTQYGGIRETLDKLDPEMTHLARSIGANVKRRGDFDGVMKSAFGGMTPDDLVEQSDAEKAAQEALAMAEQSLNLSEEQYQRLLQDLRGAVAQRPEMPEMQVPGVNAAQALVTGAAMALDPGHAYDIGAAPFIANRNLADQQYKQDMAGYGDALDARGERLSLMGNEAEQAGRRFAAGEKGVADARGLLAEIRNAESAREAQLKLTELQQQGSLENKRLDMEAAGFKDAAARNDRAIDDYNGNVRAAMTAGTLVGNSDLAKQFATQREQLIAQGVDPNRLAIPDTSMTQAAKTSERMSDMDKWRRDMEEAQFNWKKDTWNKEFELNRQKFEESKKTDSPDVTAKRKAISAIDKKIKDVREKYLANERVGAQKAKSTATDPEASQIDNQEAFTYEQNKLLAEFQLARREKDKLLGLQRPEEDYFNMDIDGAVFTEPMGIVGPIQFPKGMFATPSNPAPKGTPKGTPKPKGKTNLRDKYGY